MQTIGQKLRATREARKATLSQAAEATRIKSTQLEMMETDKFDQLGAVIYAKGFLRLYGEFLGLDPEALVRAYLEAHGPERPTLPHETAPKLVERRTPLSRELAPETDLGAEPPGYGGPRGRSSAKAAPEAPPRMTLREFLDQREVRSALRAAALAVAALVAVWLGVEGIRVLARRMAERPAAAVPTGLTAPVEQPPDPYLDPQSVRPPAAPARRP
jgi:transcriptional regulator with XRE-family HTH domain